MFLRLWPTKKLLYLPIEAHHIETITSKIQSARSTTSNKTSKMTLSPKSLAGPGYIILNAIRVMNVIGLLAVITASIVMLVKTSLASKFFFFDAVSHVLTCITGMFLLASELSLFRSYFARNWPLLSPVHGFVTLALSMIVLGINMLGNLNKPATSEKSLGLPFWRIVIGSGIVIFILGFVNLIASYVFRDRTQGITARQVRAHGAVAIHKTPMTSSSTPVAPELAQAYIPNPITPTKSGSPFRILTSERRESLLPSYHSASSAATSPIKEPVTPTSRYSRATNCTKKKVFGMFGANRQSVGPKLPVNVHEREMEISAPRGVNPQFAHLVQRPDSAMHPSRTGESEAFRWRAAS
ncbi:hypothetical protein LTR85_006834 [Meristemomyces frigidus]|nr:hypothetical protein LTR85_006834 [Meristemomyces frigidus]